MTPIYVINLDYAQERRLNIIKQMEKYGIENYHFFSAINGKENPDFPLFKKYNDKKRLLRKGRSLSLGELGCFASHFLLWEKCIELNSAIVVLEDDLIIHENFCSLLPCLENLPSDIQFFWLHENKRSLKPKKIHCTLDQQLALGVFDKEFICTYGYYLTPKAAERLIQHCEEWIYPVDDQMAQFYYHKLPNLGLVSYCVECTDELPSQISFNRGKIAFKYKLSREIFNAKDKLFRFGFNLKNRI